MHDPLVVAWEVVIPVPARRRISDARKPGDWRWGFRRTRRTNSENLGEPVYPWYRPIGWRLRLAGRAYELRKVGTIWHREPGGADSLTVCSRNRRRWAWHVHHWKLQWYLEQRLRRFLFERCAECGRRFPWGYAPVSHQWDGPKSRWWRIHRTNFHHECSVLGMVRRRSEEQTEVVKSLMDRIRLFGYDDKTVIEDVKRKEWRHGQLLEKMLGYERDESHQLRKVDET